MTLTALVIVAAATYGATRFLIIDSLLQTPRNWLIERLWPGVYAPIENAGLRAERRRYARLGESVPDNAAGWRGKLAELASCSYCCGWWIGVLMFWLWGVDGLARVVVEAWAVRGIHAAYLDAVSR